MRNKTTLLLILVLLALAGCRNESRSPATAPTPASSVTPKTVDSSILIPAAAAGDIVKVKELIDDGADVNVRGASGNTPLMEASYGNYPEVVRLLLQKGANIALKKNDGETAISFAKSGNHQEISEMLDQVSRLIVASGEGNLKTVTELLDKGAVVNGRGEGGRSALTEAAFGKHVDVVKLLLERGADVNAKKDDGATALSISRGAKSQPITAMLIEKGAR